MRVEYAVAWLLPLFAGAAWVWLATGRSRFRGSAAAAAGGGWVAGVFIAAAIAAWRAGTEVPHAFAAAAPWLAGSGALAWVVAALLHVRSRHAAAPAGMVRPRALPLARLCWWLLLALIVARLLVIGDEAALRPVFPWDAWSAWEVKAKAWMLLGRADAYVPMIDWLASPDASTRTMMAWNYPELLAWIEVWFASAAGGWNEPLVDLAWCGALAAFGLAAYGYWRGLGLKPVVAIGLVYALVSLPLIDAHVALAGYADLWIAVTLGLATLAWSRWLIHRERGQWLAGVAFALCLPAIKLEGAIWALLFSAVVVLDLVPPRWRWRLAVAVAALAVAGVLLGGFALPMLGLGWVHVAWGSVAIPGFRVFHLSWHPVAGALLASFFTLPNWHLFWYALAVVVALCWRVLLRERAARLLGLLVLLQLSFLFTLFFFTGAAAWAEDFTSANRLLLQIVPAAFAFVAVLLRGIPACMEDTATA